MVGLGSIPSDEDRMAMVHCPNCDHTWKAKPEWRDEPCPNCGFIVRRGAVDMRYD